ncbi:MAG: glycosyltransferase [Candidatus Omnitrophica bacterium]|nr:glycosyltransferase [Candidatus Omnitrophota bacterium]
MLKLLHIIPSMSPSYGGPSHTLQQLARALKGKGVSVTILTTHHKKETTFKDQNAEIVSIPRLTDFIFYAPLMGPWLKKNIFGFDIVHIHSLFSFPAFIGGYYARTFKKPYVIRPFGTLDAESLRHHPIRKKIYFELFEKKNLQGAQWIHCTSRSEEEALRHLGLRIPTKLIPMGLILNLDNDKTSQARDRLDPQTFGKKKLLFLGRIHPRKGLDFLMEVISKLKQRRSDFVLLLAGSGEEKYIKTLQQKIEKENIKDHIIWLGEISDRLKKRELLKQADLFLLPSHRESFGLAVVEAMEMGCPVLISDQVALAADIQEAKAGIVLPLSTEQFSNVICDILNNPKARDLFGSQGIKLVKEKFDLGKNVENLIGEYQNILKNNSSLCPINLK